MAKHSPTELAESGAQQERITIPFLILAWFFISLRIWTRTCIISNFGWDDSAMIVAGLMFTVYCAASVYIEANGGGTHITDVLQLQLLTKWVVVSEAMYVLAMMTLKISLGIFFSRIVVKPWHFVLIYGTVGVNTFSSAAAFFYCLFRCGANINQYVLQQLQNKCTPHKLDLFMAYQQAGFNTLTDLVFVTLPMSILWNANMDRKSKISVGFILCLAALGCICSIIRFRYVSGLTETDDFFWNAVNIAIWSTIEASASIIASCLATLRPCLKRILRHAHDSSALSSCIRQLSSLKSAYTSSSSHATTSTSPPLGLGARRLSVGRHTDDLAFIEFLALAETQGIPLEGADLGGERKSERKSTEVMLGKPRAQDQEFAWPPAVQRKGNAGGEEADRKRQTMHASWTLQRGVPGDGRSTEAAQATNPAPSSVYMRGGGDAV